MIFFSTNTCSDKDQLYRIKSMNSLMHLWVLWYQTEKSQNRLERLTLTGAEVKLTQSI